MNSSEIRSLCMEYAGAGNCERRKLEDVITRYAVAKIRRLDKIARKFGRRYSWDFNSDDADKYVFSEWYGGAICVCFSGNPDLEISVPFEAFNPGYEKEYEKSLKSDQG